jgi:hypothetical protein
VAWRIQKLVIDYYNSHTVSFFRSLAVLYLKFWRNFCFLSFVKSGVLLFISSTCLHVIADIWVCSVGLIKPLPRVREMKRVRCVGCKHTQMARRVLKTLRSQKWFHAVAYGLNSFAECSKKDCLKSNFELLPSRKMRCWKTLWTQDWRRKPSLGRHKTIREYGCCPHLEIAGLSRFSFEWDFISASKRGCPSLSSNSDVHFGYYTFNRLVQILLIGTWLSKIVTCRKIIAC